MTIENQMQYEITCRWIERFEEAREMLEEMQDDNSPLVDLVRSAYDSAIADLRADVAEWFAKNSS